MNGTWGVAILGCGVVGSGVMEMLTGNRAVVSASAGQDVALLYVVDIRPVDAPEGVIVTDDFERVLNDPAVRLVAETIGGTGFAYEATRRALEKGISVITSNKELVAVHGEELRRIAAEHGVRYLCEAAVCGGVPVLRPLETCLSGNRIERLFGIVNGSTNYLLTRMEQAGMSFSAALGEAKELGYVEANPDADIEGWDARRKLVILASAAFGAALRDEAVPTEGIARVTDRDMVAAHALGGTIKLIARGELTGDGWTGWVHPTFIPEDNPLHGVRGVFNALTVTGDMVGDVMFYGRGAGKLPTASALVGDLIEIARANGAAVGYRRFSNVPAFVSPDDVPVRLMLRVEQGTLPSDWQIERAVQVDGMTALITAPGPRGVWLKKVADWKEKGARVGIPVLA